MDITNKSDFVLHTLHQAGAHSMRLDQMAAIYRAEYALSQNVGLRSLHSVLRRLRGLNKITLRGEAPDICIFVANSVL